ncbi:TetR/AcrR family transcriptional regulator [Campylobacter peloridis]|uniref:TetR/AcrR family transcriptional regulator n=1 Tax=Campylobacter peloridis TaxID=488546 RepID=UPI001C73CD36|nr:TetR/AcrR family transcriptional regulator [Campylobacter peloridis]MBX1886328.1 TetR/AcrR family transcriptional regulator [Campylobacter peloridis]MBX2078115.1 TetR/AcrR family transcriptional regulator [Campylobacter peloridis]
MNKNTEKPLSKSQLRLEKIKQIALESFLKNGYEATNLKDIIKQTGGSFSSVYEHYKNKEGLFRAVLDDFTEKHFLRALKHMENVENQKLEDFLYEFCLAYLEIFNDEKTIAIARIIFSQVYNEKTNLSEWFEEESERAVEFILQKRFYQEKNSNISSNSKFLSSTFCAMLRGDFFMQSVFKNKISMSKDEQIKHAEKIVKLFTQGIINFY